MYGKHCQRKNLFSNFIKNAGSLGKLYQIEEKGSEREREKRDRRRYNDIERERERERER